MFQPAIPSITYKWIILLIVELALGYSTDIALSIDFFQSDLLIVSQLSKSIDDDSENNIDEKDVN